MTDTVHARLAASLIVVRSDPFRVLMVRRPDRGAFPGAWVFPGGVVDPDDRDEAWAAHVAAGDLDEDERAVRIGALRECAEETGLLVGHGPVVRDGRPFRVVVAEAGIRLDLLALTPFAHWTTPEGLARRFDTRFLLAEAPGGDVSPALGEVVEARWMEPATAVEDAVAGREHMLFPTVANLDLLVEVGTFEAAVAAARGRKRYPVMPIVDRGADGRRITIPAEAGYPRSEWFVPTTGGS
jgi:8-oxo-dGTP pyrophosphatase MutT (NUDIX family)